MTAIDLAWHRLRDHVSIAQSHIYACQADMDFLSYETREPTFPEARLAKLADETEALVASMRDMVASAGRARADREEAIERVDALVANVALSLVEEGT